VSVLFGFPVRGNEGLHSARPSEWGVNLTVFFEGAGRESWVEAGETRKVHQPALGSEPLQGWPGFDVWRTLESSPTSFGSRRSPLYRLVQVKDTGLARCAPLRRIRYLCDRRLRS